MSIQYNPNGNGYYYPTAQPVQAQPVYANGKVDGNIYVAQPVEPGIQYGGAAPAQVIYSGAQYPAQGYQYQPQGYYSGPGPSSAYRQPTYSSPVYGNRNQMYRDIRSEEQMHYYAREQRRRQELADEMCCLAGLTAGCCLCLALD